MVTLNELIYNIKDIKYGGVSSNDTDLSDDQVAFWIRIVRALLLRQEFERNKMTNPSLVQDLGCVPIECVDRVECCNLGYTSEEYLHRTVNKIPAPLFINWAGLHNPAIFTYIGLVTHDKPFEFTSEAIVNQAKHKKYTASMPRAFYRNERIYITNIKNPSNLELINIKGIFEDPEEAKKFNKCDGELCFTRDQPYPITPYLIDPMQDIILDKYLGMISQTKADKENNARDN